MSTLTHDDYTIAWICALPLEVAAARVMLDKIHNPLRQPSSDPNAYELGELNGHYIVIASLPAGVYGTVSAATVVSRMRSTFPRLQYALMVGIGGGVPSKANDIRLGDVVVSKPSRTYSGVVQYDYGKAIQGGIFESTGTLNKPPPMLLMHMSQLEAKQMTEGRDAVSKIVSDVLRRNPYISEGFPRPEQRMDLLFLSGYRHATRDEGCEKCDKKQLVQRQKRDTRSPYIHYGLIASGNQVMKDPVTRDRLGQQHGILCFEMEAAGLMDELPTLVIRGISDYCDSHKQKEWQGYAALTAAAFARLLMLDVPMQRTDPGLVNQKVRHWVVPFARNPKFVGRQQELAELEEMISTQDGPSRVAITGLGGVGKTQIALEMAYRIRERDKDCSIFWVPCTSYAMIEQTLLNMAQTLGISDATPAESKERIKAYLSSERGGRWVLIFDNADDAKVWLEGEKTGPALEEFIPQSDQGRIIFTSRNLELAVDLTFSNIIAIPDIDPDTATQILQKSLARKELLNDRMAMTALLEQLTYLPLAVVQASAYINKKRIDLSSYSALMKETEEEAVELLSEDFRDPGRYRGIQNPVMTTWLISFNQIKHQDQLAADYLSFMACINPRKIPQSLLPPQAPKKQADALGLLNAYSFISRQDTDISMHRLVHIALRSWLRKNELFSHWIRRVADQIQQVFPDDDHENRQLWREYLPHALALVLENGFREFQKDFIHLTWNIAGCLARDGRFHEAEVLYSQLMQINQVENGAKHPSTLNSMAGLAVIYMYQGRWNEAEELELHVMETRKTMLGAEHPDTLTSMANLAATFQSQGRWNEAEKLELHVLETRKSVLGAEHPDTLVSMAYLASVYMDCGRLDEAEKLNRQILTITKSVLGAEHPHTLTNMANLAATYGYQGRWNEAEKLEQQVLETRKMVLGAGHPETVTSMANLAATYGNQGRRNEAEKLELQVLEARKTMLGAEHPRTLISMANLATTYRNQGRWNEAEELELHVLEIRQRVLGAEHPDTLFSMGNLATTYQDQGRWNEAEELELHVLEIRQRVLGAEHPDTLISMANLARTYQNQGRWNEAEKLGLHVLEKRKTVIGVEHPDTLVSMSYLALVDMHHGRWDEAEKLNRQILTITKSVLGAQHPHTLTYMENLAHTLKSQGELQDSLTLMEELFQLRTKVLGSGHPDTRSSASVVAEWKDELNASESQQVQLETIQIRPPQLLQGIFTSPSIATQRHPFAGLCLSDHPLIIASRTPFLRPHGQDMQSLD